MRIKCNKCGCEELIGENGILFCGYCLPAPDVSQYLVFGCSECGGMIVYTSATECFCSCCNTEFIIEEMIESETHVGE